MSFKKPKSNGNGFWKFAMDLKKQPENKNLTAQQLQALAGEQWTKMSPGDRQKYQNTVKTRRVPHAYTSDGVPLAHLERLEYEKQIKTKEMKDDINLIITRWKSSESLINEVFLIIHINHLCYHQNADKWYICEISIAPFSLRHGVYIDDIFHQYVNPGDLPLGYYGPAKLHSDQTHQLLEFVQNSDKTPVENTQAVFRELITYIRKYADFDSLPILYASDKTLAMTQKVIDVFCHDFNFYEPIKVYNLQYMFYVLKNAVFETPVWKSDTFSYSEIEKDFYAFTNNISCTYHESCDCTLHCSQSIVIRYGYVICSNCCPDHGIVLNPRWHIPDRPVHDGASSSWVDSSNDEDVKPNTHFIGSASDNFYSSDVMSDFDFA